LRVIVVWAINVTQVSKLEEQVLEFLWPDIGGNVSHKQRLASFIAIASTIAAGRGA